MGPLGFFSWGYQGDPNSKNFPNNDHRAQSIQVCMGLGFMIRDCVGIVCKKASKGMLRFRSRNMLRFESDTPMFFAAYRMFHTCDRLRASGGGCFLHVL